MKNTKSYFNRAWLVLAALLLSAFAAFSLAGCKTDDDDDLPDNVSYLNSDSLLVGTWKSSYGEVYEISTTKLKNGGSWGDCYAGNNLVVKETTSSSGYIYIKYTRAINSDNSYSETAPDVGKWYAINYKNLSDDAVSISAAYKDGGATSMESLDEAVEEFTVENGYFDSYSDCTRQ